MRAFALVGLLCSCATAQMSLTPEQSTRVERELNGSSRYTRIAFHVTPFFGDTTKRFLSPTDPRLVQLLSNPDGTSVNPGAIERTVPVGTHARITKVEFPSGFAMADRVLYTPRTLIWLTVELEGQSKNATPLLMVLRPGLRTDAEVLSEVERYLSRDDASGQLAEAPDAVRAAVNAKKAIPEMTALTLEMAWGYPERKSLAMDGEDKLETWYWGDGKTSVSLRNGKVTAITPPK